MLEDLLISSPEPLAPELVNEIRVSNRLIRVEGRIREVVDFLKNWKDDKIPPDEVISLAIEKLEAI